MRTLNKFVFSTLAFFTMSALLVACNDNPQKPQSNFGGPSTPGGSENPQNGGSSFGRPETVVKTADNTWHHLHFFHAKRQSGESNFRIRTNLTEVVSSRYAQ